MTPEIPDPRVTRFLILSDGRSGTMMLTDTLDESPKVKFFNLYGLNIERPERYWLNWELFQQQHADTVTHVGTTMHRVGDSWFARIQGMTFDLFWKMVRDRHDKAILLHRNNKLRQFLSRKVGQVLGSYHVSSPREKQPEPIPVDTVELADFVELVESLRERIDQYFPYRINVVYEDLADNWDATFPMIEDYLGMPRSGLQPVTFRQETRPLSEVIANYDDVAAWCRDNNHDWTD